MDKKETVSIVKDVRSVRGAHSGYGSSGQGPELGGGFPKAVSERSILKAKWGSLSWTREGKARQAESTV